jgi:hypothetical protein
MDHDVERIVAQFEEMVGLDQLERLVGQGRAVHRDLVPHAPGRVVERFLHRRRRIRSGSHLAKGAARRCQDHSREAGLPTMKTLQDGAVLRIHGNQFTAAGAGGCPHQVARHDQRLLVGEGHPFPGAKRARVASSPAEPTTALSTMSTSG